MASRFEKMLRRLDAVPVAPAAAAGLFVGSTAGGLLLWDPSVPRVAAVGALVAAAIPLARAARAATRVVQPMSEPPTGEKIQLPDRRLTLPLDMIRLRGGTFWMGSSDHEADADPDEKPRHKVNVSPFAIGKYAVTQAQYQAVMGINPSHHKGDTEPVTDVSWFDAVEFCNRLSEREGVEVVYKKRGSEVIWKRAANGYRLPTEAEREYATRAGTTTRWSFGNDEAELKDFAWYGEDWQKGSAHPVGEKRANPWGFYDLHGNVREWCWDWYGHYTTPEETNVSHLTNDKSSDNQKQNDKTNVSKVTKAAARSTDPAFLVDPLGPPSGLFRVLRGGSWHDESGWLRSACRFRNHPSSANRYFGFRCVRGVPRQHGR